MQSLTVFRPAVARDSSNPSRPWRQAVPVAALAVAVALLGVVPAVADQPLPLAAEMAAAARQIVPKLEEAGVQNVGVLKFRVIDGKASDPDVSARLGTINGDLAAQLQTAIVLNVSKHKPIAVLRDPNAVAATIAGASHLTPGGQEKLFAATYPVVVGGADERVRPDALLFGVGRVSDNLQTIRVAIAMIRATDRTQEKLCEFDASLEPENLTAVGASFVATSGALTQGSAGVEPAFDVALLSRGIRLDPRMSFTTLDEVKSELVGLIGPSHGIGYMFVLPSYMPEPIMSVVVRFYTRP